MARIKVTGYIDTDELPDEHVDLDNATGLSNAGYEALHKVSGERFAYDLGDLDDLDTELVED